jgi:uncharacterized membrane protein (GlpM family)
MSVFFPLSISLALKLLASAATVVFASLAAEWSGPLGAALIASLPISAGPAYILLALDHDTEFIAHTAEASLVGLPATAAFVVIYAYLARRFGLAISLLTALLSWAAFAYVLQRLSLALPAALVFNSCAFFVSALATRHLKTAAIPAGLVRRWWDLPARATLAAILVGFVLFVGGAFGSTAAGLAAVFPLTMTSLVLILHVRLGWQVSVATLVNTLIGMVGFGVALWTVAVSAHRIGSTSALWLGLAASVLWNSILLLEGRRALRLRA